MTIHRYKYEYAIDQEVMIKSLNLPGRIDAVLTDHSGTQYAIVYWAMSKRERVWVYGYEIKERK